MNKQERRKRRGLEMERKNDGEHTEELKMKKQEKRKGGGEGGEKDKGEENKE